MTPQIDTMAAISTRLPHGAAALPSDRSRPRGVRPAGGARM